MSEAAGTERHGRARALGVSRKTLSSILNGRAGISPEMAVRLSLAFGTTAESWMNQQVQHDLWHVERRRKKLRVAKLSAACLFGSSIQFRLTSRRSAASGPLTVSDISDEFSPLVGCSGPLAGACALPSAPNHQPVRPRSDTKARVATVDSPEITAWARIVIPLRFASAHFV